MTLDDLLSRLGAIEALVPNTPENHDLLWAAHSLLQDVRAEIRPSPLWEASRAVLSAWNRRPDAIPDYPAIAQLRAALADLELHP